MNTNSKFYQLKQIIKNAAEMQKIIKQHRKTVNFKGEKRETIELYTFDWSREKSCYIPKKVKVYLSPTTAQYLIQAPWNSWTAQDENGNSINISGVSFIDAPIAFTQTGSSLRCLNEAYALLKYERKTKKNEYLEKLKKESKDDVYLQQIMEMFRDEENE
jgi:hypothetical protein